MVLCHGCGQSFAVPSGYNRNKIQCPACGVICAVPADAARKDEPARKRGGDSTSGAGRAAAPKAKAEEANEVPAPQKQADPVSFPLYDDEPEPVRAPKPVPEAQSKKIDTRVKCRRCGRLITRQRECPSCDKGGDEPLREEPTPVAPGRKSDGTLALGLDDTEDSPRVKKQPADEEDDSPYFLADKDLPICPECRKQMVMDAVVCAKCGFDTRTRKKAKRTYQPMDLSWESDMTMLQRLKWLGLAQVIHIGLGVVSLAVGLGIWPFIVAWPLLVGLLVFVLGTYDRIDLLRDERGRVTLRKTWRFAFVPMPAVETDVRGYEGVSTGTWHDADVFEWVIFLLLLCQAIVPALIWWYHAIHKPHFHVALAVDHGRAEVWVYRGRSEEQMNEIANALANATGMRRIP